MAQNVTLLGASYSECPAILLPKTGGGTARFDDCSVVTATASDVAFGKIFVASDGTITAGAASGGGTPSVTQDANGYIVLDDDPGTAIQVDSLSVTANGTYTASSGHAYSPVVVNVSGGGGGSEDAIIMRSISGAYENSTVTTIGAYAFIQCSNLTAVSFPNVTTIGSCAFSSCINLSTVSFPSASTISASAFYRCSSLTEAIFPNATSIGSSAFYICGNLSTAIFSEATYVGSYMFTSCSNLTTVSFPKASTVYTGAFDGCSALTTITLPSAKSFYAAAFRSCRTLLSLYLPGSTLVTLGNSNAFISTPMSTYTTYTSGVYGSIYVPASLYNNYISAQYWSLYASRFVSV